MNKLVPGAQLSVIVPTFNERENIQSLIENVDEALNGISWEIVFVDDNSPDGTASLVRKFASRDRRVRIIHRVGRRGLSSACVEGILSTASPIIAIMDADHQHDEQKLCTMYEIITTKDVSIVVGSRYTEGGSVGAWDYDRIAMSKLATKLANLLTRSSLTDPMSGFFMMRRDDFSRALPQLSAIGFKVLLDIMTSSPTPLRAIEVPYTFGVRSKGQSKLDSMVLWEFLLLMLDKTIGRWVPVRFISFAMVGGTGVIVHFTVLTLLFKATDLSFIASQTVATFVAISSNFILNNLLTYRDRRLRGSKLLFGWITFNLVCALGAAANVGVAGWLYLQNSKWFLSAV